MAVCPAETKIITAGLDGDIVITPVQAYAGFVSGSAASFHRVIRCAPVKCLRVEEYLSASQELFSTCPARGEVEILPCPGIALKSVQF